MGTDQPLYLDSLIRAFTVLCTINWGICIWAIKAVLMLVLGPDATISTDIMNSGLLPIKTWWFEHIGSRNIILVAVRNLYHFVGFPFALWPHELSLCIYWCCCMQDLQIPHRWWYFWKKRKEKNVINTHITLLIYTG